MSNKSTHLPEVSGGIESVTGTLTVETGLRSLQSAVATLGEDAVATEASVSVTPIDPPAGGTYKLTLSVWNADGATPGASATKVNWMAFGK